MAHLIAEETSESGNLRLVGDMRYDADRTLALLAALGRRFC
jgi:hypothetical protein